MQRRQTLAEAVQIDVVHRRVGLVLQHLTDQPRQQPAIAVTLAARSSHQQFSPRDGPHAFAICCYGLLLVTSAGSVLFVFVWRGCCL